MGLPTDAGASPDETLNNGESIHDNNNWDGKLPGKPPADRRAIVTNAGILSDPEFSDEDAPPVEQIDADEGRYDTAVSAFLTNSQTCWMTMNLTRMYVASIQ